MMGNMNPMQQMMWNMMQNSMGGQRMRGSIDCDEFEECLEEYCREVARGRREVPRAFKRMLKKAWEGAKEAVGRGRYDDDDDDEEQEEYSGRRHQGRRQREHGGAGTRRGSGRFWDKIRRLHQNKGNIVNLNDEMMRCFPEATPEEQNILRKMAIEYNEDTRKLLSNLMNDDDDDE